MTAPKTEQSVSERLLRLNACAPGCYGRCVECPDDLAAEAATLLDSQAAVIATLTSALTNVRQIISDGAVTGFNYKDGDWAERLYFSQQKTSAALTSAALKGPADGS